MKPTMDDVQVVLNRFDASDWDELRIDHPDFHLHVYRTPGDRRPSTSPAVSPGVTAQAAAAPTEAGTAVGTVPAPSSSGVAAPVASPGDEGAPLRAGMVEVLAPTLGTFYRAPKPGAAPFVEVGQEVGPSTELCILEVMKLFTSVQAGVTGVVREVLVKDGELVEHNQVLFVIEQTSS